MTLDQIAIKHQTDKASQFTRTYAKPHDYCVHLEKFFEPMRYKPINLLEIGVGGGESIRTWLEYFPHAIVVGIDIVKCTNPWNTPGESLDPRYCFVHGSQSSRVFWSSFKKQIGRKWDIIIDDGSHVSKDIIETFQALWPVLNLNGIYEVEDLAVAPEAASYLKQRAAFGDVGNFYFVGEMVILQKK
jgi:hypothetical protein